MNGLDLLGAEPPVRTIPKITWTRSAISLGAGALAAVLVKKHPVLAFFGASAAASNAQAALAGERTWRESLLRMGRHIVATAGSLSIPKHPALGYVAGAVAGDLLIATDGNGIVDEAMGVLRNKHANKDIIEAEYVELPAHPNTTTALARAGK